MSISTSAGIGSLVGIVIAVPAILLAIYHFLIFPNIDGVFNDLNFYVADGSSSHYLYWFFFWGVGLSGFLGALKVTSNKSD